MTSKPNYPKLSDLDFGNIDARTEASSSPNLLVDGFYDFENAAYRIASGDGWVLIGPKGSGKSASFEHLALKWGSVPNRHLTRWELASFPVSDVTTLQVGSSPGPSSTRAAWEFLLLLRIFDSLINDQEAKVAGSEARLHRALIEAGLVGEPDLRAKLFDWSKTMTRFRVPSANQGDAVDSVELTALQLIGDLHRAIGNVRTPSRHILAIDGLDSFFVQTDAQHESLGALVDATYEINSFLAGISLSSTVVIAIRNDMFERIPSTDSAKLGDHAIELDWGRSGKGTGDELWDLVGRKAKTSVRESFTGSALGDMRKAYLANDIRIGRFTDIPTYFLRYTRLLPRDLIALLNELKKVHGGNHQVSENNARAAVRMYSETYFIREVTNGLSRTVADVSQDQVNIFMDSLRALSSRYFSIGDLMPEIDDQLSRSQVRALLKQLFLIDAIGVQQTKGASVHTNFVYRRSAGGGFSTSGSFLLHNCLVEAWNLNW